MKPRFFIYTFYDTVYYCVCDASNKTVTYAIRTNGVFDAKRYDSTILDFGWFDESRSRGAQIKEVPIEEAVLMEEFDSFFQE